ncbi:MAG: transcription antitermination factor NusB [Armatimonadota bacterium]|nr:transcription antitermination factor NusB [Armatimonadota bacterium]
MKTARRAAREIALNVLYQWDSAKIPFEEALETALEHADLSRLGDEQRIQAAREYARVLARGVKECLSEIDSHIERLAEDWPLERQPAVDRNILRMAIYEISHVNSVPPVVAIDEAVELAKKYSTADSGKFVNGVLAAYLREITSEKSS